MAGGPFFADSYAILAHLNGDPAYASRFAQAPEFVTGAWNVYEVEYALVRRGVHQQEISRALAPFRARARPASAAALSAAARFRRRMNDQKRRCSYVDAAGYAQAHELDLPFLTGDAAFDGIEGTEFLEASR